MFQLEYFFMSIFETFPTNLFFFAIKIDNILKFSFLPYISHISTVGVRSKKSLAFPKLSKASSF